MINLENNMCLSEFDQSSVKQYLDRLFMCNCWQKVHTEMQTNASFWNKKLEEVKGEVTNASLKRLQSISLSLTSVAQKSVLLFSNG